MCSLEFGQNIQAPERLGLVKRITLPSNDHPRTHYAKNGNVHIAYQVVGDGPIDLVYSSGIFSNIEVAWEHPSWSKFYKRLASFSRLIIFDLRGVGLSDRGDERPYLEIQTDDLQAVMDAAGCESAAIFGSVRSAAVSAMFAATRPERVRSLILFALVVKAISSPDSTLGVPPEGREEWEANFYADFGTGHQLALQAPTAFRDKDLVEWWGRFERLMSSPGRIREYLTLWRSIDLRGLLPAIDVPTLLIHRRDDPVVSIEQSRYAATQIKNSRLVELDGIDHLPIFGDSDAVLDEVEEFVTGSRPTRPVERFLTTVMFIDLVGSTQRASTLGDAAWLALLEGFMNSARAELARHRGRLVKTTGDGFLACFDGPARATRCACSIVEHVKGLRLSARAGLHTGECELLGDDLGGIAVHVAARVMSLAEPDQVLTTSTVKDLSLGSEVRFTENRQSELKGVPGTWSLFRAE